MEEDQLERPSEPPSAESEKLREEQEEVIQEEPVMVRLVAVPSLLSSFLRAAAQLPIPSP